MQVPSTGRQSGCGSCAYISDEYVRSNVRFTFGRLGCGYPQPRRSMVRRCGLRIMCNGVEEPVHAYFNAMSSRPRRASGSGIGPSWTAKVNSRSIFLKATQSTSHGCFKPLPRSRYRRHIQSSGLGHRHAGSSQHQPGPSDGTSRLICVDLRGCGSKPLFIAGARRHRSATLRVVPYAGSALPVVSGPQRKGELPGVRESAPLSLQYQSGLQYRDGSCKHRSRRTGAALRGRCADRDGDIVLDGIAAARCVPVAPLAIWICRAGGQPAIGHRSAQPRACGGQTRTCCARPVGNFHRGGGWRPSHPTRAGARAYLTVASSPAGLCITQDAFNNQTTSWQASHLRADHPGHGFLVADTEQLALRPLA